MFRSFLTCNQKTYIGFVVYCTSAAPIFILDFLFDGRFNGDASARNCFSICTIPIDRVNTYRRLSASHHRLTDTA